MSRRSTNNGNGEGKEDAGSSNEWAVEHECALYAACLNSLQKIDGGIQYGSKTNASDFKVIRDAIYNSGDFCRPQTVPIIRLGVIGSPESGRMQIVKSLLSPSSPSLNDQLGLRLKYALRLFTKPYLVLIREESEAPSQEFSAWVDLVLVVANSSYATTQAEKFLIQLNQYRDTRSVFIALASVKTSLRSSNQFEARFQLLCSQAPMIKGDLTKNQDGTKILKEACEKFIRNKIEDAKRLNVLQSGMYPNSPCPAKAIAVSRTPISSGQATVPNSKPVRDNVASMLRASSRNTATAKSSAQTRRVIDKTPGQATALVLKRTPGSALPKVTFGGEIKSKGENEYLPTFERTSMTTALPQLRSILKSGEPDYTRKTGGVRVIEPYEANKLANLKAFPKCLNFGATNNKTAFSKSVVTNKKQTSCGSTTTKSAGRMCKQNRTDPDATTDSDDEPPRGTK